MRISDWSSDVCSSDLDTHYDRGGTRTNIHEARHVAEAVIRHAREHPGQSLGVATFSVAQRQAILKELELLRRENPDVEEYFLGGKIGRASCRERVCQYV